MITWGHNERTEAIQGPLCLASSRKALQSLSAILHDTPKMPDKAQAPFRHDNFAWIASAAKAASR
jgi:hypothetical protein